MRKFLFLPLFFLAGLSHAIVFINNPPSTGGGGVGISSVPAGQMVFVSTNGSNSNGTAGRVDLPFQTLSAAQSAASFGQTILVYAGSYSISVPLGKNGVNWDFESGAVVIATANAAVFYDAGVPMSFNVFGRGKFISTSLASGWVDLNGDILDGSVVRLSTTSTISISCQLISQRNTSNPHFNLWAVEQEAGNLFIDADRIESVGNSNAYAVGWDNGQMIVHAKEIYAPHAAVIGGVNNTPTGDGFFDVDHIYSDGSASQAVLSTSQDATSKLWVRCPLIEASGSAVILTGSGSSGKVYVTAQKIISNDGLSPIVSLSGSNPQLWLSAHKITAQGTQDPISVTAGTARVTLLQIEDTGGTMPEAVNVSGGALELSGPSINSITGDGLVCSGGTITVRNFTVATSAGKFDLKQSLTGRIQVGSGSGTNANGSFTSSGTINYIPSYILNQNTLQDGATLYVNEAIINGNFIENSVPSTSFGHEVSSLTITASNNTFGNTHSITFTRYGNTSPANLNLLSYGSDSTLYSGIGITQNQTSIQDQSNTYFATGNGGGNGETMVLSSGTGILNLPHDSTFGVYGSSITGKPIFGAYSADGSGNSTARFKVNQGSVTSSVPIFTTNLNVSSSMTANVPVTIGTTTVRGSLTLGGGQTSITANGTIATSKIINANADVKHAIGDALYVHDFAVGSGLTDSGSFTGNAQSVLPSFNVNDPTFDVVYWGSGTQDPVQFGFSLALGNVMQLLMGTGYMQVQGHTLVNGNLQLLSQSTSRGICLNGSGVVTSLDLPISSRTVAGSVAGSGTYGNVVFIPLTSSGTWVLTGLADLNANTATVTQWQVAVSTNSGNTTTDQNAGDNQLSGTLPTTVFDGGQTIPNYIVTLTNMATAYLKVNATYSVATPKAAGSLKAIKLYQ